MADGLPFPIFQLVRHRQERGLYHAALFDPSDSHYDLRLGGQHERSVYAGIYAEPERPSGGWAD